MKRSLTLLCHITRIKGKINSNCQIKANFKSDKLQFLRTKIYSINLHSVNPFEILVGKNNQWTVIFDFYFCSHG